MKSYTKLFYGIITMALIVSVNIFSSSEAFAGKFDAAVEKIVMQKDADQRISFVEKLEKVLPIIQARFEAKASASIDASEKENAQKKAMLVTEIIKSLAPVKAKLTAATGDKTDDKDDMVDDETDTSSDDNKPQDDWIYYGWIANAAMEAKGTMEEKFGVYAMFEEKENEITVHWYDAKTNTVSTDENWGPLVMKLDEALTKELGYKAYTVSSKGTYNVNVRVIAHLKNGEYLFLGIENTGHSFRNPSVTEGYLFTTNKTKLNAWGKDTAYIELWNDIKFAVVNQHINLDEVK